VLDCYCIYIPRRLFSLSKEKGPKLLVSSLQEFTKPLSPLLNTKFQIAPCAFVRLNVNSQRNLTKAFLEGYSKSNDRPLIYTAGVPWCHAGCVG